MGGTLSIRLNPPAGRSRTLSLGQAFVPIMELH